MTAAPASSSNLHPSPDIAPRACRLINLLNWIITYGQELAAALQQGSQPHRFATIAYRFQTTDLAAILARIARGLMLAGALRAHLVQQQALGRDVQPSPPRLPCTPSLRDPKAATRPRVRHTNIIDLPLDRLPSADAIAAELRRRPIGAILVDICRDLCMLPGDLNREQHDELIQAVIAYDGNLATLLFSSPLLDKVNERTRRFLAGEPFDDSVEWVIPAIPPSAPALPAGPRDYPRQPIAA